MLTDHDKLDAILEEDERLDLVKLFEKVSQFMPFQKSLSFLWNIVFTYYNNFSSSNKEYF